jgi:hypothetical protein
MIYSTEELTKYINSCSANTLKWAQKNLIDIFADNWGYIINCNLGTIFTKKTLAKMLPFITKEFNLLKSIVKATSLIYKNPATRKAKISDGPEAAEGESRSVPVYDEVYEEAIEAARIDTRMSVVNRYTNLLRNVLVRPVMLDDKLRYQIMTFDNATVLQDEDDPSRLVAVQYYTGLSLPDYDGIYKTSRGTLDGIETFKFEEYKYRIQYSIESADPEAGESEVVMYRKWKYLSKSGDGIPAENLVEEKPLPKYVDRDGRPTLPFTLFTASESADGSLNFTEGYDVVDATIGIAVMLVELNHLIKYQSFKQGYISANIKETPAEFTSDPSAWMLLPQSADGKSATAGVLDMQSNIMALWSAIKERIVMVLAQYGINPSDFLMTSAPSSGFSKMIENIKLLEGREAELPRYADFEKDLYYKTVMVHNADRSSGAKPMSETAKFSIVFGSIEYPTDPSVKISEEEYLIRNHIASVVDIIKLRNPALSDEEALAVYRKNIDFNVEGKPASTMAKIVGNMTGTAGKTAPREEPAAEEEPEDDEEESGNE